MRPNPGRSPRRTAHSRPETPVTVTEAASIRWARLADDSWIRATLIDIEPLDTIRATARQPEHDHWSSTGSTGTHPVLTFAAIGLALIFAGVIVGCAIQRHKYRNCR